MTRRTRLTLLITSLVVVGIIAWLWISWSELHFEKPPIEAAVDRDYQFVSQSKDDFSSRLIYRHGDEDLELEIIAGLDAESAKLLIDDGVMGIHALYADALSAYPESLSRQIKTPERFQPVLTRREIHGLTCTIMTLYATDRRSFGAVSDDTAKRRALLAWVYLPIEHVVYKIRIFAPLTVSPQELQQKFERLLTP
jgi:hypothetical protein